MTNNIQRKWYYYSHKMVDYLEHQRALLQESYCTFITWYSGVYSLFELKRRKPRLSLSLSPGIAHIMIFRMEPSQFMTLLDDDDDEGGVDAASLIVTKGIKADMHMVYTKRSAYSTKLTLDSVSQSRNAAPVL